MWQVGFPVELFVKHGVPEMLKGSIKEQTKSKHSASSRWIILCLISIRESSSHPVLRILQLNALNQGVTQK